MRHTSQFAGRKMAALRGTVGYSNALAHGGWGATITPFPGWAEMLGAVKNGDCDFALLMRPLKFEVPDEMGLQRDFVDDIVHQFHIAVHRGDRLTLERINEALATVRHNGTFDRIFAKWIGPIEPRSIRLADVRAYFLPATLVLLLFVAIFWWQRLLNRRLVRQAKALHESEEKYRLLVENANEGIYVVQEGVFRFANAMAHRLTGVNDGELLGRRSVDFAKSEDREPALLRQRRLLAGEVLEPEREYRINRADNREVWLKLTGVPITWEGQPATLNFAIDVTESRRAELARQEAAGRLQKIAHRVPGFVYQYRLRPDGTACFPYVSDGIESIFQVSAAEVEADATKFLSRIHPDDVPAVVASIRQSARDLSVWRCEFRVRFPDGGVRWLAGNSSSEPEADGSVLWHGYIGDVTDRKKADEAIHRSLREKEALLKEVHHRVKNNLQVITSLLRMEARRSDHVLTKAVLQEMQGRIRSMALLHETLYRAGNFARVELAGYVKQLATQLFRAQNATTGAVQLVLELTAVEVEIDQAIPCGLLVNELATNALKHAFPNGARGEVRIALHREADGRVRLQVSDTGVGLPAGFDYTHCTSLGLQLVSDLARQLQGRLEVGPGASFTVTFTPIASAEAMPAQATTGP
jgi:PAS domain S-box-containing protein